MSEATIVGIDLVKWVFQLHGARDDGSVVFRKKLSGAQFAAFLAQHPRCIIAMEASRRGFARWSAGAVPGRPRPSRVASR
ncbi:transposase family protein [Rhodovulum sulfidophilum]|uniref:Transposase family protein n=1 Tax=Rhodovulum sulfidophilum TaxID=35806 RepID=A0A0D6B939_RHOSU|nr:transposase family protein [Rhodovulum sulfidophilum]